MTSHVAAVATAITPTADRTARLDLADASPFIAAAQIILKSLTRGQRLDAATLRAAMTQAFGADDTTGVWTWKHAYEAAEISFALLMRRYLPTMRVRAKDEAQLLAMVRNAAALLPSHTKRSEESQTLQQFSTPPELATLVALAAQPAATDLVLEPSAGTGQLAIHAEAAGATLLLNEIAPTRAAILKGLFPNASHSHHNGEQIHDRLDPHLIPTLIIMNPPFSASPNVTGPLAGVDFRHIKSALRRLAPGGRLVAITSHSLNPLSPQWRKAFEALVNENATVRFTAHLAGQHFARYGTTFETRLTVIDKVPAAPGQEPITFGLDASLADLAHSLVHALAARAKPQAAQPLPQTGSHPTPVSRPAPTRVQATSPTPAVTVDQITYSVVEPTPKSQAADDGLYETYEPERLRFDGAHPHPAALVQSAAMASVCPPAATYRPRLPQTLITNGILSSAQLESIVYAGEAHSQHLAGHWLPDATFDSLAAAPSDDANAVQYRRGWFLGDGTGAGKGRQVAGILLDNWLSGRRKAVWLSKNDSLLEDAQRDWSALNQEKLLIVPQSRFAHGKPITLSEGIIFSTYGTLRSAEREGKTSRLKQLTDWLGADFDGVIIFDEAHAMANAASSTTDRRTRKASQQGVAGLRLQHALPNARIVYVSATGATVIENLAYAQRLGLWGGGDLPFADRAEFVAAMHEGGIASAEVLARDLKALGLYTARSLSYQGVEVDMLEHTLTPEQIDIYDQYAAAYQVIHTNLDAAMEAASITSQEHGTLSKAAKSAARSAFEGTKVRFFNHLITAMKMPTLISAIEKDIQNGHAAVVQLVSTSEALMNRRLAQISPSEWNDLTIDVTPREYVFDYLMHSFPTQLFETYTDDDGNLQSHPAVDDNNNPVQCREAVERRDALIESLGALPPVQAALDQLIHHFGEDAVAEVTGRTRRIVRRPAPQGFALAVQNRSASSNLAETQAFMDDRKRILAFSDAGGTGRSYHADLSSLNQRKRVHYLLEAGWKADAAIQGLGRTNRTNQKHPPLFRPVASDVRGEKRFLSTIARRLDSLGAITRGQRQTGGQGMFRASDNLENTYARDALRTFYRLVTTGSIPDISHGRFEAMTGLVLTDQDGTLREDLPPIQTFLNRMLALPIATQNRLFAVFEGLVQARVEAAVAAGTHDIGVETITADRLTITERQPITTHKATGTVSELLTITRRDRNQPMDANQVRIRYADTPYVVLLINTRSQRAALQIPAAAITRDDGTVERRITLVRPMERSTLSVTDLLESNWEATNADTFTTVWDAEAARVPEYTDTTLHIVAGLLLPLWKRLPFTNPHIYRFTTSDGERVIGRLIPPTLIDSLDVSPQQALSPDEAWQRLSSGYALSLTSGMTLKPVTVMHRTRYELTGFPAKALPRLKTLGFYSEIIAWQTRLFLPTDEAGKHALVSLLALDPIAANPQAR